MKNFIRRSHLYLGLFLAPWVLFFGVSAFTIHFEESIAGWPQRATFQDPAIKQTLLARFPEPGAVAQQVVKALEVGEPGSRFTLTGQLPAYDGVIAVPVDWAGVSGKAAIFPGTTDGLITKFRPPAVTRKLPHLTSPAWTPTELEEIDRQMDSLVRNQDSSVQKVGKTALPAVRFQVVRDGEPLLVSANLGTGDVTLSAVSPPPPASFLMKMHKDYKSGPDAPWQQLAWHVMAIMVACSLAFWVITGLVMWYQLKALRTPGLVVLALSGVLFVTVVSGMWRVLS